MVAQHLCPRQLTSHQTSAPGRTSSSSGTFGSPARWDLKIMVNILFDDPSEPYHVQIPPAAKSLVIVRSPGHSGSGLVQERTLKRRGRTPSGLIGWPLARY